MNEAAIRRFPEPMPRSLAVARLAGAKVFQGVDHGALATLARDARLAGGPDAAPAGAAPEANACLYVILHGHAAISTGDKVVELAGQGEVVGEERVFGPLRGTTVRLIGPATALAIPADAVRRALDFSPRLARALMANLARREFHLLQRIECRTSRRAAERLGGFLLRQLAPNDEPQSVQLPAPKTIIASLLSMTKESLSRAFNTLATAALISVRGRQVCVSRPWQLAEAFDCPKSCTACDGIACSQAALSPSAAR